MKSPLASDPCRPVRYPGVTGNDDLKMVLAGHGWRGPDDLLELVGRGRPPHPFEDPDRYRPGAPSRVVWRMPLYHRSLPLSRKTEQGFSLEDGTGQMI